MNHPSVAQAFEMLLDELHTALSLTREQAASASREGRYDDAQARLVEAQRIEKFIAEIRTKQREWTVLSGKSHQKRTVARTRLPRGERTPDKAYRLPILQALIALGGEAKMSQVLDRVYAEMKPHLKPADLEPLPSDAHTPRWQNAAQWARQAMVDEGLLRKDSPRGVWAITEVGRKFLAQHSG